MIGGKVIDFKKSRVTGDTWVNVLEESGETCQIITDFAGVSVGDNIWWQGDKAFITNDKHNDKQIKKIGFSGTIQKPGLKDVIVSLFK